MHLRAAVLLVFVSVISSFAQLDPNAGLPVFSTEAGGQFDSVNLANGNVFIQIPLRQKVGKFPFTASINGNFGVFMAGIPGYISWNVSPFQGFGNGFGLSVPSLTTNVYATNSQQVCCQCPNGNADSEYSGFVVIDSTGAYHPINPSIQVDSQGCMGSLPSPQLTTDGSGYTIVFLSFAHGIYGEPSVEVYDKSGNLTTYSASGTTNTVMVSDPDNVTMKVVTNQINNYTQQQSVYTDTVGTTALTATTPLGGSGQAATYVYADANGNTQYTLTYKSYPLATDFGCTGITDLNGSSVPLPYQVTTPDGGTYTILYEVTPNNANARTGRIAQLSLPSGGYITYSYADRQGQTGQHYGIDCTSGVVPQLTRKVYQSTSDTNPAVWTYVNSDASSSPGQFTVTETDPLQDTITHTFLGPYETERVVKDYAQGNAVVSQTFTCYNKNYSTQSNCITHGPLQSVTQTDVYTYPNGSSTASLIETTYDCVNNQTNCYGNVIEVKQYDAGAIFPPTGTPVADTTVVYGNYSGGTCQPPPLSGTYIYDTPCAVTTKNASGAMVSQVGYTYNNSGHPIDTYNWVSGTSNYLVSSAMYSPSTGQITQSTDAAGNVTKYGYDGQCNYMLPTSTTFPMVQGVQLSSSQTWDNGCLGGVVDSSTDVNGKVTTYAYNDPLWRVTSVGYPDTGGITYTYATGAPPWSISALTKMTNGPTNTLQVTNFDGLDRPISQQWPDDPQGTDSIYTTYDLLGRTSTVSNRCRLCYAGGDSTYGVTAYTYNAANEIRMVTNPDNTVRNSTFTGRATKVVDEGNNSGSSAVTKVYQTDGLGRLISVCEVTNAPQQPNNTQPTPCQNQDITLTGFETTYTYDALGNLTNVNQSGSRQRTYLYDGLSRLTSEKNPEIGQGSTAISYVYDTQSPGDLYQRIAPLPNAATGTLTTTYTHDPLHRLTNISYANGFSPPVNYLYDQTQYQGVTFANSLGRLSVAATGTGTSAIGTGYSYDPMGRVADEWQVTPLSNPSPIHLHMTYDLLGDLTSLQNFSEVNAGNGSQGVTWTYSYNNTPSFTGVTSNWSNASHPPSLLTVSTQNPYNPLGQLINYTTGDGWTTSRTFDQRGRLAAKSISPPQAGTYTWSFGYAGNSNVISANDPFNGNWTNYTYDDFNRLSAATCVAGNQLCPSSQNNLSLGFTYDQFGNRYTQTASTGQNTNYSFNAYNQITSTSGVTYDGAGNMLTDGLPTGNGSSFIYDGENRLISITQPGASQPSVTYFYDALGNRVETGTYTGTNYAYSDYVYDPSGNMIYKFNNQGNNQDEIYAGPLHVGVYDDATANTYFQYGDQVGSMRIHTFYNYNHSTWQLYEANANGAGCSNDPFGDSLSCFGSPVDLLYFTDQLTEVADPMYTHFPNREYSTTQGRWIHPDPSGLGAVDATNPQSWDRYSYVLNSPVTNIDPYGLQCVWDDGSYDSSDDPDTGSTYQCGALGGTWVDPANFPTNFPDWSPSLGAVNAIWSNTTVTVTASAIDVDTIPIQNPTSPGPGNVPPCTPSSNSGNVTYKPGVPPASPAVQNFMQCVSGCMGGTPFRATSTSDSHSPTDPHSRGLAVDGTMSGSPGQIMQCGANCGAKYQQNEYKNPSPNATAGHYHFQLVPGKNGAVGPAMPTCHY